MLLSISNFKKIGIGSPLVIDSKNGNLVGLRGLNGVGKTSVKHAIGLCIYGPRLYKAVKRFFPKATTGVDTVLFIEGIPLQDGREVGVKRVIKFKQDADGGSLESVTFLKGDGSVEDNGEFRKVPEREVLALFPDIEAFMSVVSPEHFFARPLVEQVRFLNSLIESDVSKVEKSVIADEMEKISKYVEHNDAEKAHKDSVDYLLANYCLLQSGESLSFAKRESGDEVENDLLPSYVSGEGKELPEAIVKSMSSEFAKEFKETEGKLDLLIEQRKQSVEKFSLLGISPDADDSDSAKAKEKLITEIKGLDVEIAETEKELRAANDFANSRSRVEGLKAGQRDLLAKYDDKKATFVESFDKKATAILEGLTVTGVKNAEYAGVAIDTAFVAAVKNSTETSTIKAKIDEKKKERDAVMKVYTESFKDGDESIEKAFTAVVECYAEEERKNVLNANKDRFTSKPEELRMLIEKKATTVLNEIKNGTEIAADVRKALITISKSKKDIAVDGKKLAPAAVEAIKAFAEKTVASSVRPEAEAEYAEHRKALEAVSVFQASIRDKATAQDKVKNDTETKVKAIDAEIKTLEETIKPDESASGEAVAKFVEASKDDVMGKLDAIRALRAEFETGRAEFSEVHPFIADYKAYEAGKRTYLLEKNVDSLSKKLSNLREKKDSAVKEHSKHDVVVELRATYRSYDTDYAKYSEKRKHLSVLNVTYKGYHKKLWATKRDKLAEIVEKSSNGLFRIVEDDTRLSMEMRQSQGGEEFYSSDFSRGESILAGCFFSDILDSLSKFAIPVRFFDDLEELDEYNRKEVYKIILAGIPKDSKKLTFVTEVASGVDKKSGLEVIYGEKALSA